MSPRPLVTTLLLSLLAGFAAAGDVKVYRSNEIVDPMEVVRILEGSAPRARVMPQAGSEDPGAIRSRSIRLFDDPGAPPLAAKSRPPVAAEPAMSAPSRSDIQTARSDTQAARSEAAPIRVELAPTRRDMPKANGDVEVHAAAAGDITRNEAQRPGRASVLSLPIQFSFDSAEILPSARAQLDALAEGVQLLPESTRVVIEGHTDAAGSAEYNQQLSLRRAQSVKRYLAAVHGIEPSRLRTMGLGEYAPLVGMAPNASENRRVQFRGER